LNGNVQYGRCFNPKYGRRKGVKARPTLSRARRVGSGSVTAPAIHSVEPVSISKESNMHTNEQFLTKMTAAQLEQLKMEAAALNTNGAYTKALNEQLARLGL